MRRKKAGYNLTEKRKEELKDYAQRAKVFERLVQTYDDLKLFKTPERKRDYTQQFQPKTPRWYVDWNPRFVEYFKKCLEQSE